MNTPRTDAISKDYAFTHIDVISSMRELETQVNELRETLEAIAVQPMSNDWSRQVARAILEKTK